MGLDSFKVAPDNEGGRPSKEEEESVGKDRGYGDPYIAQEADKEWWEEKIDEVLASGEIPTDDFDDFVSSTRELSNWVHTNPISVWKQLDAEDVIDLDWEWVREEAPEEWKDLRWPKKARHEVFTGGIEDETSTDTEDEAGGLASLIDEAKGTQ